MMILLLLKKKRMLFLYEGRDLLASRLCSSIFSFFNQFLLRPYEDEKKTQILLSMEVHK